MGLLVLSIYNGGAMNTGIDIAIGLIVIVATVGFTVAILFGIGALWLT